MANRPIQNSANAAGITVKELEDWVSFEGAARILDITRNGIAYSVFHAQDYSFDTDVRAIGPKPTYVLRRAAVLERRKRKEAEARIKAAGWNVGA